MLGSPFPGSVTGWGAGVCRSYLPPGFPPSWGLSLSSVGSMMHAVAAPVPASSWQCDLRGWADAGLGDSWVLFPHPLASFSPLRGVSCLCFPQWHVATWEGGGS